jgi:hypothetical protein
VALSQQQGNQPQADYSTRTGKKYPHVSHNLGTHVVVELPDRVEIAARQADQT